MKIKFLLLVVWLKKQIMTQKLVNLKRKLMKYITTPEFNKVTVENFAARLAEADLVATKDFDVKL